MSSSKRTHTAAMFSLLNALHKERMKKPLTHGEAERHVMEARLSEAALDPRTGIITGTFEAYFQDPAVLEEVVRRQAELQAGISMFLTSRGTVVAGGRCAECPDDPDADHVEKKTDNR